MLFKKYKAKEKGEGGREQYKIMIEKGREMCNGKVNRKQKTKQRQMGGDDRREKK